MVRLRVKVIEYYGISSYYIMVHIASIRKALVTAANDSLLLRKQHRSRATHLRKKKHGFSPVMIRPADHVRRLRKMAGRVGSSQDVFEISRVVSGRVYACGQV